MKNEIKIPQYNVDLAIGKFCQEMTFFPDMLRECPAACELGRLVADKLGKTTIQYPVDLALIILEIFKRVKKDKLQSRTDVSRPLWEYTGKQLVLDILPKFTEMCFEAFPEDFAKEVHRITVSEVGPVFLSN